MPFFKDGVITAWIPLVDVSSETGSIRYIQGSQLWPERSPYTGANIQNIEHQRDRIRSDSNNDWFETIAEMNAGSISFYHKDTLHGSAINSSAFNSSNFDRYAIAIGLLTDEAKLDTRFDDYGYRALLKDEKYCPVIYQNNSISNS